MIKSTYDSFTHEIDICWPTKEQILTRCIQKMYIRVRWIRFERSFIFFLRLIDRILMIEMFQCIISAMVALKHCPYSIPSLHHFVIDSQWSMTLFNVFHCWMSLIEIFQENIERTNDVSIDMLRFTVNWIHNTYSYEMKSMVK
jgi:hypothetical protein